MIKKAAIFVALAMLASCAEETKDNAASEQATADTLPEIPPLTYTWSQAKA